MKTSTASTPSSRFTIICASLLITLAASASCVLAQNNINVPGNVTAGGNVNSGGYTSAGSYFYSPGYINIAGFGTIGTYLNVGATFKVGASSSTLGTNSSALGVAAAAPSYSSVAVGRYNKLTASDGTAASTGIWVGKDPLFSVGNGSSSAAPSDALTVYKDGTIIMSKAQGDILMGQFGN